MKIVVCTFVLSDDVIVFTYESKIIYFVYKIMFIE